jgi:hypothetical protein
VGDGETEFFGGNGTRHRRVDIPHDHHEVWAFLHTHPLKGHHHPGRLLGMAAGAHPEKPIGSRQFEIPEKDVRHLHVVVLTGVDELRPEHLGMLA